MGCDIHLYVEQRKNGQWRALDNFVTEDAGTEFQYVTVPYKERLYSGRSYNLFAILADVRNGRGFAGIKTGEGFNPISEPRGVPNDASPEYKHQVEEAGRDGHSHSYHTLRQLLDYDWTQTTVLSGWVSAAEWVKWSWYDRGQGEGPENYSGRIYGAMIEHLTPAQMDAIFDEAEKHDYQARLALAEQHPHKYAQAEWTEPYYRAASNFLADTIPRLLKLAGGVEGAEDIRIVFFFDN